jgi:alpha 1,2-mannosyltransferase
MYEDNIFDDYKYYLRLDTDSFILSRIPYDIFEWMESNSFDYGTIQQAIQIDNPKVVIGLWDFVEKWIDNEKITTLIDVSKIPNGTMFYTNFELGKLSFFKNEPYKKFYNAIKNSGGIYINRWGDAPIKYLGVKLFTEKIGYVSDFIYQHGAIYYT